MDSPPAPAASGAAQTTSATRPGVRAPPKRSHQREVPSLLSLVGAATRPPPLTWAERAKRAAESSAAATATADLPTSAPPPPKTNPLAHRLALGKKLKRDDLAGLSERDQDALRLYRSLQYRNTEAYKAKRQAHEDLMRRKTVERWSHEAVDGAVALKPSVVVHIADHLERAVAASALSAAPAVGKTTPGPGVKFAFRGVPLPAQGSVQPGSTTSALATASTTATVTTGVSDIGSGGVLPATAVWGRQRTTPTVPSVVVITSTAPQVRSVPSSALPTTAKKTKTKDSKLQPQRKQNDAAPHSAEAPPAPVLPDSDGVVIVKRAKKGLQETLALGGASASSAARLQPASASASSSKLLRVKNKPNELVRHKERLFRRLKKPTRLKHRVLQARRSALLDAAATLGVASSTAAHAAVDSRANTAKASDGKRQRSAFEVTTQPTAGGAHVGSAAKSLVKQLEAVEAIARLQVEVRAAYDEREKTLLDERKQQYGAAVARLRRGGSHAVRRATDAAAVRAANVANAEKIPESTGATVATSSAVHAPAEVDNRSGVMRDADAEGDEGVDGDEALQPDPTTDEILQPLRELQLARAGAYPTLHLLSSAGSHPAPWLVDLRFIPQQQQQQQRSTKEKPRPKASAAAKADHGSGTNAAVPEDAEQPAAADTTAAAEATPQEGVVVVVAVVVEEAARAGEEPVVGFREGLTWSHRPPWWPPARMIRSYVTNTLTRPLDKACEVLFDKLRVLQHKLKTTQPLKYPKHMRFVCGLREAERGLKSKRVRLVVIAPDVEAVDALDAALCRIVELCTVNNVPHFFALSRGAMGRVMKQYNNRVSLVAMYSAEGAYEECREAIRLGREAKQQFAELRLDPALRDV